MAINTPSAGRRYVLIVPVRDEERFLEASLECFVGQSVRPTEIVVVNDGSTDRTPEIAEQFAAQYPWIRVVHRADRGGRKVGGGVIEAFYAGYEALEMTEYDYLCKIDGDITLKPTYFESLMRKFEENPRLGGASGKCWNPVGDELVEERISDESVIGAVNFWRRACWEDMGGFVREVMWDGITWHRCRMLGWETRSFRDEALTIIHHRLMGSSQGSIVQGRLRWGRGQWFMGTHPLYILASGFFRMRERPYVLGGILIVSGYFLGWAKGVNRFDDPSFRLELRRWQMRKLGLGFMAPRARAKT